MQNQPISLVLLLVPFVNQLTLGLDRVPEPGWIDQFKRPREGYTAVRGAQPRAFQFHEKIATVRADSHVAQEVINHFKKYLEMATRGYQADLEPEAANKAQEQRGQIEEAMAAARKRAEVVSKQKI